MTKQNKDQNQYNELWSNALDYWSRPGDGGILREPLNSARAAWFGPDLEKDKSKWLTELTREESDLLRDSVINASQRVFPTFHSKEKRDDISDDELSKLSVEDLSLPDYFKELIDVLQHELGDGVNGIGAHVIRGIPVQEWNLAQQKFFFWVLGQYIGTPGVQDLDGKPLNHVKDVGASSKTERQYKTNANILPHCDAADVVGLLCLSQAKSGGKSRIVSSVSVYNEFLKKYGKSNPEMIERLYSPFPVDLRINTASYIPVTPCKYSADGQLRSFYQTEYLRSTYLHPFDPPNNGKMPELDAKVLNAYNEIISDSRLYLDMELQQGDVQLLSNHVVYHARTAYKDDSSSKRHLLRLWLKMDQHPARLNENWRQTLSRNVEKLFLNLSLEWGMARYKIRKAEYEYQQQKKRLNEGYRRNSYFLNSLEANHLINF